MAGEEAIDETDLVGNEEAEAQAQQARSGDQAAIHPDKARAGVGKWQGNRGRNQDHTGDSADSKNQEIQDCPARLMNCGEDQKRNGGGACQAVHDADEEGAQGVKEAQLGERAA